MIRSQPTYNKICEKCGCTFIVKSNNWKISKLCKSCKRNLKLNYLAKYYLNTLKSRRAEKRALDKKKEK